MKKGFYLIGRDKENSKTYIFGINPIRFETLAEAETERSMQDLELLGDEVDIQILEVE